MEEISNFLSKIHETGSFEIVAFKPDKSCLAVVCSKMTAGEAFRNLYDAAPDATGFYCSVNPTNRPKYLSPMRARSNAADIPRRNHLLVDIDGCKSGKTPEDRERLRRESIELAKRISSDLTSEGWTEPVIVHSGNGAQMWYRIDEPAESDLVSRTLKALAAKYDTGELHIDTAVADAGRIARLPGTWNRKADYPSSEHRMAKVVSAPEPDPMDGDVSLVAVPHDALVTLAARVPADNAAPDWNGLKQIPGLELDTDDNREQFRNWLNKQPGGIEGKGGRTHLLTVARFGGDFGLTADIVLEELTTAENGDGKTYNDRCDPPWELDEMATLIRSSYNGRKEPLGCKTSAGEEYRRKQDVELFDDGKVAAVSTIKEAAEGGEKPESLRKHLHTGDYYLTLKNVDPVYWVDQRIATRDFIIDINGLPGCGKSTLVYQWAICVLNGVDFLGRKTFPVAENGRVFKPLIISCEEDDSVIGERIQRQVNKLCGGDGAVPAVLDLQSIDASFYRPASKRIEFTELFDAVEKVIRDDGYNFVFIDNRGEIYHANENLREEVAPFRRRFRNFYRETGCQWAFLSHNNKENKTSGSTAWEGSARIQIQMEKAERHEIFTIRETKRNGGTPQFWGKFAFDPEGFILVPAGAAEVDEAFTIEDKLEKIVEIVRQTEPEGITRKDLYAKIKADKFFGGDKPAELVKAAEGKGLIAEKKTRRDRKLHIVTGE